MIDIKWNPTSRELRQFAGLFLGIFGCLGLYLHFVSHVEPWGAGLATVAIVVGLTGVAVPAAIKPLFVGWMIAAFPIGWTISHLLLGLIYFGVITPIGLLLRLFGQDPMNRTFDRDAETYWSEREPVKDVARYFRQF